MITVYMKWEEQLPSIKKAINQKKKKKIFKCIDI
jgi:hypothetical protein